MKKIVLLQKTLMALACGLTLSTASAVPILHQTSQGGYQGSTLGGTSWTTFSAMMAAKNPLASTSDFSSLAQLSTYGAVWVDQELGNTLSAAEISSLHSYVSAGNKLVMVGENSSWANWDLSIMAVAGGGFALECSHESGTALLSNELTVGVGSVVNLCGSTLNNTGAPTMLFSNNVAGLFTVGTGQVLVLGDANMFDDSYIGSANNKVFAQNIVDWINIPLAQGSEGDVPEPATLGLLGLGMAGLAFARRRKV